MQHLISLIHQKYEYINKMKATLFSQFVKKRLSELGYSQRKCAALVGISQAQLSRILSGNSIPSADWIEPLAKALRVSTPELLSAYNGKGYKSGIGLDEVIRFVDEQEEIRVLTRIIEANNKRIQELLGEPEKQVGEVKPFKRDAG